METIATASRIHPLFAGAAVSVIALSATGIAALTGLLPSSKAEPVPYTAPTSLSAQQAIGARQAVEAQQLAAAQLAAQQFSPQAQQLAAAPLTAQQLAPQAQQLAAAPVPAQQFSPQALQPAQFSPEPAPVVRKPAVQAQPERVIVREIVYRDAPPRKTVRKAPTRSYAARHQKPVYASAPVVQERKPNYVAIGTGAVVGGLIGNQIGGGNGKKLATLAGIIGGGYVGNEIANRNK